MAWFSKLSEGSDLKAVIPVYFLKFSIKLIILTHTENKKGAEIAPLLALWERKGGGALWRSGSLRVKWSQNLKWLLRLPQKLL